MQPDQNKLRWWITRKRNKWTASRFTSAQAVNVSKYRQIKGPFESDYHAKLAMARL